MLNETFSQVKNTSIFPRKGLKNVRIFVFGRHEEEWDLRNNEKTTKHVGPSIVTGLKHRPYP